MHTGECRIFPDPILSATRRIRSYGVLVSAGQPSPGHSSIVRSPFFLSLSSMQSSQAWTEVPQTRKLKMKMDMLFWGFGWSGFGQKHHRHDQANLRSWRTITVITNTAKLTTLTQSSVLSWPQSKLTEYTVMEDWNLDQTKLGRISQHFSYFWKLCFFSIRYLSCKCILPRACWSFCITCSLVCFIGKIQISW